MDKLTKTLLLGMAAGIIEAILLLFLSIGWQATVAGLLHWMCAALIITYAKMNMSGWLSGICIGLLTALPMATMTLTVDTSAWMPLTLSAIILGCALGYTAERLIPHIQK